MSVIDIEFPGNIAMVATIADLRAVPSTYIPDNSFYSVGGVGFYTFDVGSMAVDDGDLVLRPNDRTALQAGRWLFGSQGRPGAADNTYTSYSALLASDPNEKSARLVGDTDNPPQPDGNFNYDTSIGAWVRQKADGVSYSRPSSGALTRPAAAAVAALGVTSGDFATPSQALSQSITDGVPLYLAGQNIAVSSSLNGVPGNFALLGKAGKTTLAATAGLAAIVDVRNPSEISFSPFVVRDLSLDGANVVTDAAVSVQWRRSYEIANIFAYNAPVGLRLKDANTGIVRNFRTSGVGIGIHSVGSNHQVTYDSVAPIGASDVGIKIEALGTGNDGNFAQAFINPVVQSGTGRCIEITVGAQAEIFSGYLGEATNGAVIDNKGGVLTMFGGVVFFDYNPLDNPGAAPPVYQTTTANYLVHPIGSGVVGQGGTTHFKNTRVAAQSNRGLSQLVHLEPGEVDLTRNGKVVFENMDMYCVLSGGGLFNGDPIGTLGAPQGLCARNGSSWVATASSGSDPTNYTSVQGGMFPASARTVTNTSTAPPPIVGLYTPLLSVDYRLAQPMFFIMCYQSTRPVTVRTGTGPLVGGGSTIGTPPATGVLTANGWKTYVTAEPISSPLTSGVVEMFITSAGAGDAVALLRAGLADADFINSGGKSGVLCNLYYP